MNIAIRDAFGDALLLLGQADSRVVALDADVGSSARSIRFGHAFPDRYYNFGIAEFNMTAAAAGMAANGLIPFVNTFAAFIATRAADAINNLIAHDGLNVKLCGAYAGVSDSYDGASHHALFDMALMSALPNMTIVSPADAVETRKAVFAAAAWDGPVYLRLSRAELPVITREDADFQIGKGAVLREGGDVTLIATGGTVCRALDAASLLVADGIDARVVNLHTVKPIDQSLIKACARETGRIVTVEEHSTYGGLGAAVAHALAESPVPITMLGVDRATGSGAYETLIAQYGLDGASVAARVRAIIAS